MSRKPLDWSTSKSVGGVTEIAVLAPIRKGFVPGERRTYEERLRFAISTIADRVRRGVPTGLETVPTIHFGRMMVIRPEQFLVHSKVPGLDYEPETAVPRPIDDWQEDGPASSDAPEFRSWLLTLVEFDGDLKVYFRDVAQFLNADFDSVFCNCEDFPTTREFEKFWTWVRRYQMSTDLFYARYADLSVVRIKELAEFKRRFDAFVARVRSPAGPRVESMDEMFDEFLRQTQQIASDFPAPGGTFRTGGE